MSKLKKAMVLSLVIFLLLSTFLFLSSCRKEKELIMSSTTSTQDSGLFDALLPVFQKKTGYTVKVIAVGTGEAIELGKRGEADLIFVHSRKAEDEFVADGWGLNRKDVMYNDFVVAGPQSDPADISGSSSAADAFQRIAAQQSAFVSRGDDSGTHKKEMALWASSGLEPEGDFFIETGQGMGESLRIADEKQAYILTDRGTWLAQKDTFSITVLFEKDADLFNPYGIIAVNPAKHPDLEIDYDGAMLFIEWIVSEEAQEIIRTFGVEEYGQPLFYPDAK
jgi:tungstate transport system substrate-binding protein